MRQQLKVEDVACAHDAGMNNCGKLVFEQATSGSAESPFVETGAKAECWERTGCGGVF